MSEREYFYLYLIFTDANEITAKRTVLKKIQL